MASENGSFLSGTHVPGLYAQLRVDIINGTLAPGELLQEAVLAARHGVSRTPVREALLRLEQDRLIQRTAQGTRVRVRSPEEILEIYEARVTLEGAVTSAAARRHSRFDIASIRRANEDFRSGDPKRPTELVAANQAFHRAIWRAGHNLTLIDLLERVEAHLVRYTETTLAYPGRFETASAEHDAMLSAIEAKDADLAEQLAKAHFDHAREIRLEMFTRDGG